MARCCRPNRSSRLCRHPTPNFPIPSQPSSNVPVPTVDRRPRSRRDREPLRVCRSSPCLASARTVNPAPSPSTPEPPDAISQQTNHLQLFLDKDRNHVVISLFDTEPPLPPPHTPSRIFA